MSMRYRHACAAPPSPGGASAGSCAWALSSWLSPAPARTRAAGLDDAVGQALQPLQTPAHPGGSHRQQYHVSAWRAHGIPDYALSRAGQQTPHRTSRLSSSSTCVKFPGCTILSQHRGTSAPGSTCACVGSGAASRVQPASTISAAAASHLPPQRPSSIADGRTSDCVRGRKRARACECARGCAVKSPTVRPSDGRRLQSIDMSPQGDPRANSSCSLTKTLVLLRRRERNEWCGDCTGNVTPAR